MSSGVFLQDQKEEEAAAASAPVDSDSIDCDLVLLMVLGDYGYRSSSALGVAVGCLVGKSRVRL